MNCVYYGIRFDEDAVRTCSTNVGGLELCKLPEYKAFSNFSYKLFVNDLINHLDERKNVAEILNSGNIPQYCENCFCLTSNAPDFFDKNIDDKKIHRIDIANWRKCNLKCCYCVQKESRYKNDFNHRLKYLHKKHIKKANGIPLQYQHYKVMPIIKILDKRNELSDKKLEIYIGGGESALYQEIDEILDFFYERYKNSFIIIMTNGLLFNKRFGKLLADNRGLVSISIDAGFRETYKKIKGVDCFDKVVSNIKKYSNFTKNKTCLSVKYILNIGINDNTEEILKFFEIIKYVEAGTIQLAIDYSEANSNKKVPEHYYELYKIFQNETEKLKCHFDVDSRFKNILKTGIIR